MRKYFQPSSPARTAIRMAALPQESKVEMDGVMAKIDLACGPYRIVSLMSREAAEDLAWTLMNTVEFVFNH